MFKTNTYKSTIKIDPIEIYKCGITKAIDSYYEHTSVTNPYHNLIGKMKDGTIKWEIEDGAGVFSVGITWNSHGETDGLMMHIAWLKECLSVLANGCGISRCDFLKEFDNSVRITKIYCPGTKDHGTMFAGFFFTA